MSNIKLVGPHVHLNGTSRESLIKQYMESATKVREALDTVAQNAPHKRDYYPLGDAVWNRAWAQHDHRVQVLRAIYSDLMKIAEGLAT